MRFCSQRKYAELEHAHVVQAGLIQRLQRDKAQHGELQVFPSPVSLLSSNTD
jgi:hypothetical protein